MTDREIWESVKGKLPCDVHHERMKQIQDDLKEIKKGMDDVRHWIIGNGTVEKSIMFRMSNLEASDKKRKWWNKILIGSSLPIVLGALGWAVVEVLKLIL